VNADQRGVQAAPRVVPVLQIHPDGQSESLTQCE
jgi:hypothetical protein